MLLLHAPDVTRCLLVPTPPLLFMSVLITSERRRDESVVFYNVVYYASNIFQKYLVRIDHGLARKQGVAGWLPVRTVYPRSFPFPV